MTVFVQVMRPFFEDFRGPKKNCSKTAIFPVKKRRRPFYSYTTEWDRPQETTNSGPLRKLTFFQCK